MRKNLLRTAPSGVELLGTVTHFDASQNWSVDISSLGIQSGDVIFAVATADTGDTTGYSVDSPFVEIVDYGTGKQHLYAYCNATGSVTTFSCNSGLDLTGTSITVIAFRGAQAFGNVLNTDYTVNDRTTEATHDPATAPAATAYGDYVVILVSSDDYTVTAADVGSSLTGYTLVSETSSASEKSGIYYKEITASGTENPGTISLAGTVNISSVTIPVFAS